MTPAGRSPESIEGSEWVLDADVVVEAIGNRPKPDYAAVVSECRRDDTALIKADPETGATNLGGRGLFAGGDIVRGPALVVNAVQDGKKAAEAIKDYLRTIGGTVMSKKRMPISICPSNFAGKRFKNPFLLSSSPVSNSAEMVAEAFEAGWSGVVFKTLNSDRLPIVHPSPRMSSYHLRPQASWSDFRTWSRYQTGP